MQMYSLIFNSKYEMWIIFNVLEQDTRSVYDNEERLTKNEI